MSQCTGNRLRQLVETKVVRTRRQRVVSGDRVAPTNSVTSKKCDETLEGDVWRPDTGQPLPERSSGAPCGRLCGKDVGDTISEGVHAKGAVSLMDVATKKARGRERIPLWWPCAREAVGGAFGHFSLECRPLGAD